MLKSPARHDLSLSGRRTNREGDPITRIEITETWSYVVRRWRLRGRCRDDTWRPFTANAFRCCDCGVWSPTGVRTPFTARDFGARAIGRDYCAHVELYSFGYCSLSTFPVYM